MSHRRPLVLLAVILIAATAAHGQEVNPLAGLKAAIKGAQFDRAAQIAEQLLADGTGAADEVRYLLAHAQAEAGQWDLSIENARRLQRDHAETDWFRKARFLEARGLIARRDFEAAEAIYAEEAARLLSADRKREIAGVLVDIADDLSADADPNDPAATPPDYARARQFYEQALQMQIGRDMRDDILFRAATVAGLAGDHHGAINLFRTYLDEFDPTWAGPVDSVERMRGELPIEPPPAGAHAMDARLGLAKAQLHAGAPHHARRNAEDLHALLDDGDAMRTDASWLIVRTWNLPHVAAHDLERALEAARTFAETYPRSSYRLVARWLIADTLYHHGRLDDARDAFELASSFDVGDTPDDVLPEYGRTARDLAPEWRALAQYRIADVFYRQRQYEDAIKNWRLYVADFPNGANWADAQRMVIQAQFDTCLDAISDDEHDEATTLLETFLKEHPLDGRAPDALFLIGQMKAAAANALHDDADNVLLGTPQDDEPSDVTNARNAYNEAMTAWKRLVGKYPGHEQSSVAMLRTGIILEERFGDLERALETYRSINWGSGHGHAQQRIAIMTAPHLALRTERTYRSDETPEVAVDVRNIEKLTVRQYVLDPEAYFRKTHATTGIESLDIALIAPDETWEIDVAGYRKYQPLKQRIEIPFDGDQPGVCLVNVSDGTIEATTLVIRSDIDLIMKSSRRELLVYVQDMLGDAPADGVRVLVSDGASVFATGVTGADGVFHTRNERLASADNLRVFTERDGHIAANMLNTGHLATSTGPTRRGYLYTDRPAYRPGERVHARGILREVLDGSFVTPVSESFVIAVTDPRGRLLREETLELSRFGTFDVSFSLDDGAAEGAYVVSARRMDGKGSISSAAFHVGRFELRRMKLDIEFDEDVVFRGDEVAATITASYYWGEPVPGAGIRYSLPDGRTFVERANDEGILEVTFDTTGMAPGSVLGFSAAIDGEDAHTSGLVYMPTHGFNLGIAADRALAIAGETFDVTLNASAPNGDGVERELTIDVIRRVVQPADDVLGAAPWLGRGHAAYAEMTVDTHTVTTDEDGKAALALTIDEGGEHVLRVRGTDRFDQAVVSQTVIVVSGDDDATRLRLFAGADTVDVGADASFRLHSRAEDGLALVTWEAESILEHRIVRVNGGDNTIDMTVGHEHFPNFALSVSMLDDRALSQAVTYVDVRRELRIAIEPMDEIATPGEPLAVDISVTDQLGRPVEAELSLALVDQAIYAVHADNTPDIKAFFEQGTRRYAAFAVASSNGFAYAASTQHIDQTILDELTRVAQGQQMAGEIQVQVLYDDYAGLAAANEPVRAIAGRLSGASRDGVYFQQPQSGSGGGGGFGGGGGQLRTQQEAAYAKNIEGLAVDRWYEPNKMPIDQLGSVVDRRAYRARKNRARHATFGADFDFEEDGESLTPAIDRYESGWWRADIVTDADGAATIEIPMPHRATAWRLTARGTGTETLVGDEVTEVISRHDLFVELKGPDSARTGDEVRMIARVHNLTDAAGPATLELVVSSGDRTFNTLQRDVELVANGTTELVFPAVDVPDVGALTFTVNAQASDRAATSDQSVAVQPWGLEFVANGGGVTQGDAAVSLELPGDRDYATRHMTIRVGADVSRIVLDLGLDDFGPRRLVGANGGVMPAPPTQMRTAGSELLATVSALAYANDVNADARSIDRLRARARGLVASLSSTALDDGGWSWNRGGASDWSTTCVAFWALNGANDAGLRVDPGVLDRASQYLRQAIQRAEAADHTSRALMVHALSTRDEAEYKLANALYRERNSLEPVALACTALALHALDRDELAADAVQVLLARSAGGHWNTNSRRHPWLNDSIDTTAMVLLAILTVQPGAPEAAPAAEYLLSHLGCYGHHGGRLRGATVAALGAWFGDGKVANDDLRITVSVNGNELQTVTRRGSTGATFIDVPANLLQAGRNEIRFAGVGRGSYAYAATMHGVSDDFETTAGWRNRPWVSGRYYYHDDLEYRGRPLGAQSTSPVTALEAGQRTRVFVNISNGSYPGRIVLEEPLPAGAHLVPGTLTGNFSDWDLHNGVLRMYYDAHRHIDDVSYELVGFASGTYRVPPSTLRDITHPSRVRMAAPSELVVLAPGEVSDDAYQMNDSERYALGTAYFNDGLHAEALEFLWPLYDREHKYAEREVARMLLWIHTTDELFDAGRVVSAFELLSIRHPELTIPFDRILDVGRAYRDIGEFERAWLVERATIESSFIVDSSVAAVLQDQAQLLASIDFQEALWWDYPSTSIVASSHFALSQLLYEKADEAVALASSGHAIRLDVPGRDTATCEDAATRSEVLVDVLRLIDAFLVHHPSNPLADDAAFSAANALLDLKAYDRVVTVSEAGRERFADSDFATSFQYMEALGHFWQRDYDPALEAARVVAGGESDDRDFARYILGQIHHAQGLPGDAIRWYETVKDVYADAAEAIDYFERKSVELDEVTIVRPGEAVELELRHRNIEEASLQVYKVDLMTLYLREKNLANITGVNLAGIEPALVEMMSLGDGKDYADRSTTTSLALEDEGAYLVICRGDDLFASGLVVITPLEIEIQEHAAAGRVRINVVDHTTGMRPEQVHVKAIGSADSSFRSGDTDLRGLFVADGLNGTVTAIARDDESRYAFYRGETWLGTQAPPAPRAAAPMESAGQELREEEKAIDFQDNIRFRNDMMQSEYNRQWDATRRGGYKGVQIDKAK